MPARRSREQTEAPSSAPLRALEILLEHTFRDPSLLDLALTHRSFAYESRTGPAPGPPDAKSQKNTPGTDNEQLEFLGDAILGLCVAEALFREFPQCTEGELTRMRAALVSRARMAELGAALGLGEHLLLGRSAEQNGGRKKPALLANAAEAVIAAVYLDACRSGNRAGSEPGNGVGLEPICKLVERFLLGPDRETMRQALAGDGAHSALRDHKTLLQERVQATGAGRLRYVDTAQTGPAHQRRFAVEAQIHEGDDTRTLAAAEGSSKKEAQQRAAELALAAWPGAEAAAKPPRRHNGAAKGAA